MHMLQHGSVVRGYGELKQKSSRVMNTWSSYPQPNHLGEAEVHLWIATLAVIPEKSSHFQSILSLDEQERAGRFQKIRDAQRYVAARGSLRSLLGAIWRLSLTECSLPTTLSASRVLLVKELRLP